MLRPLHPMECRNDGKFMIGLDTVHTSFAAQVAHVYLANEVSI